MCCMSGITKGCLEISCPLSFLWDDRREWEGKCSGRIQTSGDHHFLPLEQHHSSMGTNSGRVLLLELNSLQDSGWIGTLGVGSPEGSPQELATEFWQLGEGAFGNPGTRN